MRINFKDKTILPKNAKRTIEIIKALEINDPLFNEAIQKITLTKIKDALSVAYGYTNSADLKAHLSSEFPQLKDLTNQERLDLENAIMHSVGSYLNSLRMPPNIAYSIASALNEHLEREVGVAKKVKRANKFDTYKNLTKIYGITIPALKKNLWTTGALVGIFPSKRAIEKDWCRVTIMVSESYGIKPKVLWNPEYVGRVQKKRGYTALTPYQQLALPNGLSNAGTNLGKLAKSLAKILDDKGIDDGYGYPWEFTAMEVSMHPVAHFAIGEQLNPYNAVKVMTQRREYLNSLFDRLLPAAKEVNPKEATEIEESINKVIDWIVQY